MLSCTLSRSQAWSKIKKEVNVKMQTSSVCIISSLFPPTCKRLKTWIYTATIIIQHCGSFRCSKMNRCERILVCEKKNRIVMVWLRRRMILLNFNFTPNKEYLIGHHQSVPDDSHVENSNNPGCDAHTEDPQQCVTARKHFYKLIECFFYFVTFLLALFLGPWAEAELRDAITIEIHE